jgi:ABC-type nickel/cobalt efflux system permease component RcnA
MAGRGLWTVLAATAVGLATARVQAASHREAPLALGRVAFGLVLILAFSAGLAAVLTAIGLVFVHARSWFARLPRGGALGRYVPVASAVAVSVAGLLIVARAIGQMS